MNTIKFNEFEAQVLSFSKNTSYYSNGMSGNVSCEIRTENYSALAELSTEPITSIVIKHNDDVIYNVSNIQMQLSNTNEYLTDDKINVTLSFNIGTQTSSPEEI